MKLMESLNHGLNGLKDFTEEVSVASEQSVKIRDSDKRETMNESETRAEIIDRKLKVCG